MLKATMAYLQPSAQLTPKEAEQMQFEERMFDKQTEFQLKAKELEIILAKHEAKLNSWFRIPIYILKLPILVLFGLAYIAHVIVKKDPPKEFWEFINK
jgi:hypothetical protein